MFKLHESTRRRLCRAAFVLLAIVPTATLVAWGAMRHTPGYEAAWESQLSIELGLVVQTDSISHPRPGHLLLKNLRLRNPETGAEILRCPQLEASWYGEALILAPTQPELADGGFDSLWKSLDRRMRGHSPNAKIEIHLAECNLTSRSEAGDLTLEPLSGSIRQTSDGPMAEARFKVAGQPMTDDATLTVWRRLANGVAVTEIEFSTGAAPLPCALLAPLANFVSWTGPRSTLQGIISASDDGRGAFRGTVSQIDLQTLVSEHFVHQMSGACDLHVDLADWGPDGITVAHGRLHGHGGIISQSLVGAGVHMLSLGSPRPMSDDRKIVRYDALAVRFVIDTSGLTLKGDCGTASSGVLLANQGTPLWIEPPTQPQPAANLLRALIPSREFHAPATAESRALINIIPLPSLDKMDADATPRGRVTGPTRQQP